MALKKLALPFLYVLSLAIALIASNMILVAISFFWVCVGIGWYFFDSDGSFRIRLRPKALGPERFAFVYFFIPALLIHLYTIFLIMIGKTEREVMSSNMITYMPLMLTIVSIYLFQKDAIVYDFIAIAAAWVTQAAMAIIKNGFGIVVLTLRSVLTGESTGTYFEFNDIVHAVGYAWVYYLFFHKKSKKSTLGLVFGLAIIFVMGLKRIGLIAVLVTTFCYLIISKLNVKNAYRISRWISVGTIAGGIGYVAFVSNYKVFEGVLRKYHIETLARNYFYRHILGKTSFDPSFWGYGRGSVKIEMLRTFKAFSHVHSDYVKMFYELGFVLFIVWLVYYYGLLPILFKKWFNYESAIVYTFVVLYTFILYLTDNTEAYFACRLIRTSLPIVYAVYYSKHSLVFKKDLKLL